VLKDINYKSQKVFRMKTRACRDGTLVYQFQCSVQEGKLWTQADVTTENHIY